MARRSVFAAAIAVAAALIGTTPVEAGVSKGELRDARAIAVGVWGEPCAERARIRFQALRSDTLGMARWDGMWDIPPGERTGCRVLLNTRRTYTWRVLCTTIVHEYGHLAGREHSERRHSAMRSSYSGPYSRCVRGSAARRWDR